MTPIVAKRWTKAAVPVKPLCRTTKTLLSLRGWGVRDRSPTLRPFAAGTMASVRH
jgi:hypothetical protein